MAVRLPTPLRPMWPQLKAIHTRTTRLIAPVTRQMSRIKGGYLPGRSVAKVDQSVAGASDRMWLAQPEVHLERPVPVGEPRRHPFLVSQADETVPRVAVAELSQGRVLGPHRAIIDRQGAMIEEFGMYWGTTDWREHPIFWHPFPGPPRDVPGRLGVLATRGDHSYYHFLLDVVPRLGVLDAAGAPAPECWYVPVQRGFQREILNLAGFLPGAEVIDSDLDPHVRAERLLVPGLPDTELRTPPWAVGFLRERLLPSELERRPGRRIYVTRGSDPHSRIVTNETEVVDLLTNRGFVVVDPGAVSVSEQIRVFGEAEWIVAPHGGALANLAFASPGASVVELFAPDYVQGCYWKLADALSGVTYRYLVGAGRSPRSGKMAGVMSDITVDLAALERVLDTLPVEPPPRVARTSR
jgi:hypothetical protein